MIQLDERLSTTDSIRIPRREGGVNENSLATLQRTDTQKWRDEWQRIIDQQLVEWGINPEQFADDDLIPPSRQIIHLACTVAERCRNAGVAPPMRVVPNGRGGIVFERRGGAVFETIEIRADGFIEHVVYVNSRLHQRRRLS
jgi:hypothetical protein